MKGRPTEIKTVFYRSGICETWEVIIGCIANRNAVYDVFETEEEAQLCVKFLRSVLIDQRPMKVPRD